LGICRGSVHFERAFRPREQSSLGPDRGAAVYPLTADDDGRFALYAMTIVPSRLPIPRFRPPGPT